MDLLTAIQIVNKRPPCIQTSVSCVTVSWYVAASVKVCECVCAPPRSVSSSLIEALLFPPERLCHPFLLGTRRMWLFPRIKNLRAIKSQPTPSIHQPCVPLPSWVRGARSKPRAIYFYICFPSKEGRLWQNEILLLSVFRYNTDVHRMGFLGVRSPGKEAGIEKRVCVFCLCWGILFLNGDSL